MFIILLNFLKSRTEVVEKHQHHTTQHKCGNQHCVFSDCIHFELILPVISIQICSLASFFVVASALTNNNLTVSHIKKVELQFDSLHSVGSGLPVSKILKNKPHLFVLGNEYSQASLLSDIRTNIRELSRFTETDKRKLAFFSIKSAVPLLCGTAAQRYEKD